MGSALPRADVRLLAVAVMPNHLHLVVQQGREPLGRFMQSMLRRIAYLLHRRGAVEGPVFWRPYGCTPCHDPEHARNAVVYTHLNPVRAGICDDPGAYPWSSHQLFEPESLAAKARATKPADRVAALLDPRDCLPMFAAQPGRSLDELRGDYGRYVAWRLAVDRWASADMPPPAPPATIAALPAAWTELRWSRSFSPLFHAPAVGGRMSGRLPARPDLADLARVTLAAECVWLHVDDIRGRRGGREHARLRRLVIERGHAAGYRNVEIARFLRVSESAVSRVLCERTVR